jgi:hypothetical protein
METASAPNKACLEDTAKYHVERFAMKTCLHQIFSGALLFLCGASFAAADCNTTQQRTFDGLSGRLSKAAASPNSLVLDERVCLVATTSQILGRYPGTLADLTSVQNENLKAALAGLNIPGDQNLLANALTYSKLAADLKLACPKELREIDPSQLKISDAKKCGFIGLPGAPYGLGAITAKNESGATEGGYAKVSPDPGAGGWTYGRYQLASEKGGMKGFLDALTCPQGASSCLPADFRPIGQQLIALGGVSAAQQKQPDFVAAWVKLSLTDRSMQQAQESYQSLTSWMPVKRFFKDTLAIDLGSMSCGLREAAFSVKVQHSPQSARNIFTAATKLAGTTDSAAIVKAANQWRLDRLGAASDQGGFYSKYGGICYREVPPTENVTKAYACSYLDGVRKRWSAELSNLAELKNKECP